MRMRRLPFSVIGAALLVGLAGLLAVLQYRWLGQVSEAEREQLRRSLDGRAREFADEFDAEISAAFVALQMPRDVLDAEEWPAFGAQVERWRTTARHPQLVQAIYLAEASADRRTLRAYDAAARSFGPAADTWPERLRPLREQVVAAPPPPPPAPDGGARFVAMALSPVVPDVPALLIPVSRHTVSSSGGVSAFTLERSGTYVVALLDEDYIRRILIPALVARHFPEREAETYRVAIVSARGGVVYARGFPAGAAVDAAAADLVRPIFSLRIDIVRQLLPGGSAVAGQATDFRAVIVEHRESNVGGHSPAGAASTQVRVMRPGWRLVLVHGSGSLDEAVARARVRNLWLGFGILGVLAAGIVLVLVNGRRAGRLAAQQMDFVATVSHELRTPLAVIRSAAQNLSAGVVPEPERARRYGELIEQEGRRLTEMVEQVLEYARITGGQAVPVLEAVDVGDLAQDVARSCGPLCDEAGVELEVAEQSGEPTFVTGDAAALRRAIHNLMSNALKHGADGRWIGVTVERAAGRRHAEIRVTVSDRGRGIEASELGRVFEPFFRGRRAVDDQVHGNGLGLGLVRRVVEAHGGRVTVQSAPGQGASFTIHLPALDDGSGSEGAGSGAVVGQSSSQTGVGQSSSFARERRS